MAEENILDTIGRRLAAPLQSEFLRGVADNTNPLSQLQGHCLPLQHIFRKVREDLTADFLKQHIEASNFAYRQCRKVTFPAPTGIKINMMPVTINQLLTRRDELPPFLRAYVNMICCCLYFLPSQDRTRVMYLTIHESAVPVGQTQRRAGLHIERPGSIAVGRGGRQMTSEELRSFRWGSGFWAGYEGLWSPDENNRQPTDGIFMASTVANSCRVWPALVSEPHEVTDRHGGIEHMRPYLGDGFDMPANALFWITDRTPHESRPLGVSLPESGKVYRQFFRLVVGPVTVWYRRHSTPNPLGLEPGDDVIISDEDKFADV